MIHNTTTGYAPLDQAFEFYNTRWLQKISIARSGTPTARLNAWASPPLAEKSTLQPFAGGQSH
ncbi:hypothetical protein ACLB1Q_09305 [Escherichia coli]